MRIIASHCSFRPVRSLLLLLLLQPPPCPLRIPWRADIESRVDSLSVTIAYLAVFIPSLLAALTASVYHPSLPQVTSQAQLAPDVSDPHPGSTAGYHQESQALGGPGRSPVVPSDAPLYISQGVRAHLLSGQPPHPLF